MDSDMYKYLHEFEDKQRTLLASTINVPILASTLIGGALVTAILQFPYSTDLSSYLFVGFCGASILALLFAVAFVSAALIGYKYEKPKSPLVLSAHYEALVAWHIRNTSTEEEAKKEFKMDYEKNLAIATDANGRNNRTRGKNIFWANLSLSFSILFLVAAGVLYVNAALQQGTKIYHIRIVQ